MSVNGEFQRILAELLGFLERTPSPGVETWLAGLRGAAEVGRENVSEGARRVLELFQGPEPAPSFGSPLEIEEFARLQDHLGSLCRVILGR